MQIGKIVFVTGTISVATPYTTAPGVNVLAGLPAPVTASKFQSFESSFDNGTIIPVRVTVSSGGNLQIRKGTAGQTGYDINYIYIAA